MTEPTEADRAKAAEATDLEQVIAEWREELAAAIVAEPRDRYGHTEADHDAAGACRRPSMAARVAVSATELPLGSDTGVAFMRGWDAAVADLRARVEAVAEELDREYRPIRHPGVHPIAARLRAAVTDTTGDPA